ncbi:PHD-finger family protein [Loa loa]|uniref:PHD-finger family protein n=1 Tax=Loa loa TaxID=7209 RepID=A0A1I7V8X2_LOALO|nr:PHD-finger family protein [Loa loa]EFO21171.1 PHD-finger family protein [Loa loa]
MRNGVVGIRGRLRRRCTASLNDSQICYSEEEAPIIKKDLNRTVTPQRFSRVSRSEVVGDQDSFSQRHHFSTDFAEDKDDANSGQYLVKRKFYIVADGGIPSELYRTDLLHKMKQEEDSDASSDDETAFVSMSDRWKEEWNHGVQVPLSKKLPDFVVRHSPCSSSVVSRVRPRVSLKRHGSLISVHDRRYTGDKHKHIIMPKLRNYQADRRDRVYLCKLNEKRIAVGLPAISEKIFGEVIDKLEVSCCQAIHSDLISSVASPIASADAEFDENVCCDICRQPDYEEDDKIIFCDGCNVGVHQSCYGLDSVPSDEWLCQKCMLLGYNALPHCALCPLSGGAMKCTREGDTWAHVVCALWIHEVRFADVVHREPIGNICDIPYGRWKLRCSICGTKQGACIQCSIEACTTAFHVCCALRSGLIMRIEHDNDSGIDDNNDDDDNVRMVSLCRQHSLEKMFHSNLKFCNPDALCATALTLQEMERMFFLYVSVESIAAMLSLSEDMVSDIYEYWKLRRIDNGYKALLNDKSEVERQIALRLRSSPFAVLPGRQRNEAAIRQNLEKARNLCYMVEKREKTKLCVLQCWIDTYRCVYQMLTEKNVPYSSRVLKRCIHAVSSMQQTLSDSDDVVVSSESSLVPSPSKSHWSTRSPSPPRKQLSAGNRIRERNGLSHHLRKHAIQKVLFAADTFIKNSQQSFTSGHYSLRA